MNTKITKNTQEQPREASKRYPYLGYYIGDNTTPGEARLIVMFNAPRSGMVVFVDDEVWTSGSHKLGEYSEVWMEHNFEELRDDQSVVLSND